MYYWPHAGRWLRVGADPSMLPRLAIDPRLVPRPTSFLKAPLPAAAAGPALVGPAPSPPGAQLYSSPPLGLPAVEPLVPSETNRPFRYSPAMSRLAWGARVLIACAWNDNSACLDLASMFALTASAIEAGLPFYAAGRGDPSYIQALRQAALELRRHCGV